MKIRRRTLIGGSAAALVAAQAAKAQLIGRGGGTPGGGAIGYTATVRLDGGPIYTYDPDAPGPNQTAADEGNFVSDFAGFTQRSIHCRRADTALRVYFRKDLSPDPNRIEVILELGHFTTDGGAKSLGPFTLQILKAGAPQPIPITTTSGPSTTTSAHFPSMGWWTRWRWNPTPRPIVRTGSQLLPGKLNLVPNFSASLASTYGAKNCGAGGPPLINAYSSAWASARGNNLNPVGVNECTAITGQMGGVGGRPELGIVTEWQGNWIVNGNGDALKAMLVLGEVDGGIPWHLRDSSTNWAPPDFIARPLLAWFPGRLKDYNPPYTMIDAPGVPIPSGNGGGGWAITDLYHTPSLSYMPYLATGDPYFLQNLQDKLAWLIGANYYHRQAGFSVTTIDPANTPSAFVGFNQAIPLDRAQGRGMAWGIRDIAQCYLATPTSVPSWLLPKSYFKSIADLNQQQLDDWSTSYPANHPTLPQYPGLTALGTMPGAVEVDYALYLEYMAIAFGFMVNQAGQSNWLPAYQYQTKMLLNWCNGTSGWDNRWCSPYPMFIAAGSTDYDPNPTAITDFTSAWAFGSNNALLFSQQSLADWSVPGQGSGMRPAFPRWQPNKAYHCNSWIYEVRTGAPQHANTGDVVTITFSGSFVGSPVTLSHSVTSSDVNGIIAVITSGLNTTNPITDELIAQINANSVLSKAGIKASYTNTNSDGQTNTGGSWQPYGQPGRIFIVFNSDGSSRGGGPIIGPITVTGTFRTSTNNSLYIQPNGDGVWNGHSTNPALFFRALSYQCGKSGVSAASGGPAGHLLQTLVNDATAQWCFSPEFKSNPYYVPGGPTQVGYPGYGGVFNNAGGGGQDKIYWNMAGLASMATAGITGASAARTSQKAFLDAVNTKLGMLNQQFNFSIAA